MAGSDTNSRANALLAPFETTISALDHAAWVLFLCELSSPAWPMRPPEGCSDWRALRVVPTDQLGEALDGAVKACRSRWPRQLEDAMTRARFAELEPSLLARAVAAAEIWSESVQGPPPFGGHEDLFGGLYLAQRGSAAKKDRGEFYTPSPLAQLIAGLLDVQPGEWVVEPSCGTGALLLAVIAVLRERLGWALADTVTLVGVELSPVSAELCRMQMLLSGHDPNGFHIFSGDFRQPIVGRAPDGALRVLEFHRCAGNPPFGTGHDQTPAPASPLVVPGEVMNRELRVPHEAFAEMLARGVVRSRRTGADTPPFLDPRPQ